jgi:hypothetical protein
MGTGAPRVEEGIGVWLAHTGMARAAREMCRAARRAGADTPKISLDFAQKAATTQGHACVKGSPVAFPSAAKRQEFYETVSGAASVRLSWGRWP